MSIPYNNLIVKYAFIFTISPYYVHAQVNNSAPQNAMVENDPYSNFFQRRTPSMDFLLSQIKNPGESIDYDLGSVQGSPYNNEKFIAGNLFYKGKPIKTLYYRYNSYADEIEIKETFLEDEEYKALAKDFDLSLKSGKLTYYLKPYVKTI